MILLSVLVWKKRQFDYAPLFTIHQFTHVSFIDIFRNLAFVLFDTHIRYRESAYTLNEIYIHNKASKQG